MSKAFRAASSGKLSTLKEIIKSNPDIVNQCNRDGYTPFSIAIASQQSEITDYLLQLDNLDINAGNHNISPIFVALNTNNHDIAMKLLCHKTLNPKVIIPNNTSILHYCIQFNHQDLILKLFQNPSFDHKIISPNLNENIFHIIVDIENNDLFMQIIQLINNNDHVIKMLNSLNSLSHTPLWKTIKQNRYEIAEIMLNIGADINILCSQHQTVSHLIYQLYPENELYHQLLQRHNADLSIIDMNGKTPMDIARIANDKNKQQILAQQEEQFLLEETIKMREKLKHSRIKQKKKKRRKHDKLLQIWLNANDLNNTSFSHALNMKQMTWNQLIMLNEDEMYKIIQNDCNDMEDDRIQYLLNQWNASKLQYLENQNENEEKISETEEEEEEKYEEIQQTEKHECNKYVKRFLNDFGLNELEFIFAKEKIDMTQLAEINGIWMEKHIVGVSRHAINLKMRLKLAIKELRKEIVAEMRKKIQKDYQQKYNKKSKKHNDLNKKLRKIHPYLGRLEEILSDPLNLLICGFVLFMLFTFVLFVIVGST